MSFRTHRRYFLGLAAAMLAGAPGAGAADTHGTRDQAMATAEKAAALISSQGKDNAFGVIDDPTDPFVNGDLYVFVSSIPPDRQATTSPALREKSVREANRVRASTGG